MSGRLSYATLLALTLGLAPFYPEPHVWKQLVNIASGRFTEPLDWFDLLLHGAPWIWLFIELFRRFGQSRFSERTDL